MSSIFISCTCIFIFSCCLISEARTSEDGCRLLEFGAAQELKGKRLMNHVIRSADVIDQEFCGALCFMEHNCISYNYITTSEIGKQKCELNNATYEGHEKDLQENPDYVYRGAKNPCASDPCTHEMICQTGFTHKGYRCLCPGGFTGQDCRSDIDECAEGTSRCDAHVECINTNGSYICSCKPGYHGDGKNCEDIDECAAGTSSCDANAECINTNGSYSCSCMPGYQGDGKDCEDVDECKEGTHNCIADVLCSNTKGSFICTFSTCKELYDMNLTKENKAYQLKVGTEEIQVYCVMNDTIMGPCHGGGWTLVMKIDGRKQTFHYDSHLWSNNKTFNLVGGETGFDTQETKLPTYWNTPFSKICLGMKIPGGENTNFMTLDKNAESLHSLIADGQFRATSVGRNAWKALLGSQGSLQRNCNREGFNAVSDIFNMAKARIGILGNNEDDCVLCDSRIGFGSGGDHDDTNTCGIEAVADADNGNKRMKTMGYILIQ